MRVFIFFAALMLSGPAFGQSTEARTALLPMLAMDCGVGQTADRFRRVVSSMAPAARSLFLDVLRDGPPGAVTAKVREDAAARFDRSLAWAERHPDKPHAKQWLAGADRAAYVDRAEEDADVLYRSNALEGLRLVGQRRDRMAILSIVRDRPMLSVAGERALAAIRRR